jgi:hypothetical protein
MRARYLSIPVKRLPPLLLAVGVLLAVALPAGGADGRGVPRAPARFFGIAPQTELTPHDTAYMRAGRIGSARLPVNWAEIQKTRRGPYDWSVLDREIGEAVRGGLRVLPFVYGTPRWLARRPTTLPINSGRARLAWRQFLWALVERYGPGGEFWEIHSQEVNYEPAIYPQMPIREWQVWNEANFFYFAFPASPRRYAKLLRLSTPVIRKVDPGARIVLSGLFANPDERGPRAMDAIPFLRALYRMPGIRSYFDGVAIHPYAVDAETLEEEVEEVRDVIVENHDRAGLYITEMGWGSQNDFQQVAFEQGMRGQVRQLRDSYDYLLQNRRRLNLKAVYWFSWKDVPFGCNFCDSVGLFRRGPHFRPKPAWHALVRLTGGRARP